MQKSTWRMTELCRWGCWEIDVPFIWLAPPKHTLDPSLYNCAYVYITKAQSTWLHPFFHIDQEAFGRYWTNLAKFGLMHRKHILCLQLALHLQCDPGLTRFDDLAAPSLFAQAHRMALRTPRHRHCTGHAITAQQTSTWSWRSQVSRAYVGEAFWPWVCRL